MSSKIVHLSDLCPGDILLHNGTSWISKLIRILDFTHYSHASIYVGPRGYPDGATAESIIEATIPQVHYIPVKERLEEHDNYIDVFRWHLGAEDELGSGGHPADPMLAKAATYVGHKYAYHELVLVAFLIISRITGKLSTLQRRAIALATVILTRILEKDQITLVCSELVCRSFDEAASPGPYPIRVGEGYLKSARSATQTLDGGLAPPPPSDSVDGDEVDALLSEAFDNPDEILSAALRELDEPKRLPGPVLHARTAPQGLGDELTDVEDAEDVSDDDLRAKFLSQLHAHGGSAEGAGAEPSTGFDAPPELVSPKMISKSPDVTRVGRLVIDL